MEERAKRPDEKFCHECGEIIRAKAEICPKCGCRQSAEVSHPSSDLGQVFSSAAPKSRTTAAALAILLGGVGAHKFYLRKPVYGIVYAVFVLTFIPALIGLVEGIHYLTMSDAEFQNRFAMDRLEVIGGKSCPVSPETHVKCPDCRELVLIDAKVCKHCGCKLIPQLA